MGTGVPAFYWYQHQMWIDVGRGDDPFPIRGECLSCKLVAQPHCGRTVRAAHIYHGTPGNPFPGFGHEQFFPSGDRRGADAESSHVSSRDTESPGPRT